MEKKEDNELLISIIRESFSNFNELKDNCLYLSNENLTVSELGEIINQPANQIIGFFWEKGQVINRNQVLSFELLVDYLNSMNLNVKKKK